MKAFLSGSNPPCQQLTMQTVDINNNKSSETHYVTISDISSMDPCIFSDGRNPITTDKCKQAFRSSISDNAEVMMSDDPIDQVYYACLAIIGIYILYKFMDKSR